MSRSPGGKLVSLDPTSGFEIRDAHPHEWDAAAVILAPAVGDGTAGAARQRMDAVAGEAKTAVIVGLLDHRIVGAYLLKRDGMANEIALIAVEPAERKRGIGRHLLQDALRRSGKRPLVAETDEDALGFYKACGFKLVGRRKQPDGTFRYRVGWHAPGLRFKGGSTGAVDDRPIRSSDPT